MSAPAFISIDKITKRFGIVTAVDRVELGAGHEYASSVSAARAQSSGLRRGFPDT